MSLNPEARRRIEALKASIEEIRHRYKLLLKEEDPVYLKYRDEIDKATEDRKDVLNAYEINERNAAQRMYDGTICEINDDFDHDLVHLDEAITDYIRCKYSIVKRALPKAADYFSLRTECPFMKALVGRERLENVEVELSSKPLVSEERLAKAIKENEENQKKCKVERGSLDWGLVQFSMGDPASLINGKGNPISGHILKVNEKFVHFQSDSGKEITIPVKALNMKLCRLKKK